MYKFLALFSLILIVLSCGKTKEVVQINSTDRSRYIEMFHEGLRYKQKKQFQNAKHVFEACTELNQSDDAPYFILSDNFCL